MVGQFIDRPFPPGTSLPVGSISALETGGIAPAESLENCRKAIQFTNAQSFFDRTDCYGGALKSYLKHTSVAEAMAYLESDAKANPDDNVINGQCHLLAHKISQAAYWEYQKDIGAILRQCSPTSCASNGCYHGALIEWSLSTPDFLNQLDTVCRDPESEPYTATEKINCYHGLGHGLMMSFRNDLPKTLRDCDAYITDTTGQEFCKHGAFHENSLADEQHPSKYHDPRRPLYPCADIADKYRTLCYNAVGADVIKFTDSNEAAFRVCDTVLESAYAEVCYRSVVNILTAPGSDPEKLIAICDTDGRRFRVTCWRTALAGIMTNNPHIENKDALTFCRLLPSTDQAGCYGQIRYAIQSAHSSSEAKKEIDQLCVLIPKDVREICL